jgi:hypothetical protein
VTLLHSFVIQVFIAVAWQQTRAGDERLVMARLGSARRKHRLVYCCVIAGTCFEVTVLAWRKYATIIYNDSVERALKIKFSVFSRLFLNGFNIGITASGTDTYFTCTYLKIKYGLT